MHKDCKQIRYIVKLWHETQVGNIHTCRKKQIEFADIMWELYGNLHVTED